MGAFSVYDAYYGENIYAENASLRHCAILTKKSY